MGRIIWLRPTLCLAAFVAVYLWVGTLDYKDQVQSNVHYCEMVAVWEADAHLPPQERAGWPNFKKLDCSWAVETE